MLKLSSHLAQEFRKDAGLEKELDEIRRLLSEELAFADSMEERKAFLRGYLEKIKQAVIGQQELNIENTYRLIAELKDAGTTGYSREAETKIEFVLKNQKEFLKFRMQAENLTGPAYQILVQEYQRIAVLADTWDIKAKLSGWLEYLRWRSREMILEVIKSAFKPELISSRVGLERIIVFDPLSRGDLNKILDIELTALGQLLSDSGYAGLDLESSVREAAILQGYDVANGARPLKRALKRIVLAPLAEELLRAKIEKGTRIKAGLSKCKVIFASRKIQKAKAEVTHHEVIQQIKQYAGAESIEARVNRIFGIEPLSAPGAETDTEALRQRFTINLTESGGFQPEELDISKIDDQLKKILLRQNEIKEESESLKRQLSLARDDQQKMALSQQLGKFGVELEVLNKRQALLEAKKEGREEDYGLLLDELKKDRNAEEERINSTFENLTLEAYEGLLNDLHPPFEVIEGLAAILKQKRRNYPFILSDSLLTQRMVVDSFSLNIVSGRLSGFEDTRVLRLRLEKLKDYFSLMGYFELRMRDIVQVIEADSLRKKLKTVIVIDFDEAKEELEKIRFNPFMLGYFLRMFGGLKSVSFIMTTSQSIVDDDSFERYFSLLEVSSQGRAQALENLYLFIQDYLEKKANGNSSGSKESFRIGFPAMVTAVRLWERYFASRAAVELLNLWFGAIILGKRQRQSSLEAHLADSLERLLEELGHCIRRGDISKDALLNNAGILRLIQEINLSKQRLTEKPELEVSVSEVLDYVSEEEDKKGGVEIDIDAFREGENEQILKLEGALSAKIIGQQEAIEILSRAVKIAKAGLKPSKAPVGAFIFAGPTGVGKTELCKVLGKILGMHIIRVDMSEYKTEWDLSRLIGAPPGYVGYEENEGYLFEQMRKRPNSILILDEIDKAVPAIMNILLQVLEDGRLTSNRGSTVRFNEAVIVLTTNMGMKQTIDKDGLRREVSLYPEMQDAVLSNDPKRLAEFKKRMAGSVNESARRVFRPEFLNRLDAIVVFNPLAGESLLRITAIAVDKAIQSLKNKSGIELEIGENQQEKQDIYQALMKSGYSAQEGARNMERVVERRLENPFTEYAAETGALLSRGDTVIVKSGQARFSFQHIRKADTRNPEKIAPQDKEMLEALTRRLKKRGDEPLCIEELEEMFGLRQEAKDSPGRIVEFGPEAKEFSLGIDFLKKDPALNAALREISALLQPAAAALQKEKQDDKGNAPPKKDGQAEPLSPPSEKKFTREEFEEWFKNNVEIPESLSMPRVDQDTIKTEIAEFFLSTPRSAELEKFKFQFNVGVDNAGVYWGCGILYSGEKKTPDLLMSSNPYPDVEIEKAAIRYIKNNFVFKLFGEYFGKPWDKIKEFIRISWNITVSEEVFTLESENPYLQEVYTLELEDFKPNAFFVKGSKAKRADYRKSQTDFQECWDAWLKDGETAFKAADDAPEETKRQAGQKLEFFRKYFSTASPVLSSSPVSLEAAVGAWLKEAARIAKMANFEAFVRYLEKETRHSLLIITYSCFFVTFFLINLAKFYIGVFIIWIKLQKKIISFFCFCYLILSIINSSQTTVSFFVF